MEKMCIRCSVLFFKLGVAAIFEELYEFAPRLVRQRGVYITDSDQDRTSSWQ